MNIFECPIRGHQHILSVVKTHTQAETGTKAFTYECPNGIYRWFVIDGKTLAESIRLRRPRYGWKK